MPEMQRHSFSPVYLPIRVLLFAQVACTLTQRSWVLIVNMMTSNCCVRSNRGKPKVLTQNCQLVLQTMNVAFSVLKTVAETSGQTVISVAISFIRNVQASLRMYSEHCWTLWIILVGSVQVAGHLTITQLASFVLHWPLLMKNWRTCECLWHG